TYTNWEAIIIDDGSTDNTSTIVKENFLYDPRFRYVFQQNAGLSEARNAGLKHGKGVYISFLDADDLISKDKIAIQVKYMEENELSTISFTDVKYFKHGEFGLFFNTLELN